ncbi:MAG: hypothetical protein AB1465_02550 [Patescibacteria group bacterium]
MFFKSSKLKKGIALIILIIFLFVVHFNFLQGVVFAQGAGAGTAAAGGAISCALATVALWQSPKAIEECLNRILVAIWKSAVYPLLKRMVMSLITTGDFGITWESIKDWFYYDLVFQTAEEILNRIGLTLCAQFSVQIKLALLYSLALDYYPECEFDESQIAQTINEAIQREDWEPIRRDFFRMFYMQSLPPYNQFTNYWLAKKLVNTEVTRTREDINRELTFSNGFLGTRECEDKDKDGKIDNPTKCRVITPGSYFAETVFGEYKQVEQATIGAQTLADLGALTAMAIDTLTNQAIYGMYGKLQSWVSGQKEDKSREYIKTLEKQAKQDQTMTGENKLIEFPEQQSGYKVAPLPETKSGTVAP